MPIRRTEQASSGYAAHVYGTQTLVVTAEREAAEGLVTVLDEVEATHHTSVKRNLDGETATWIVVATLGGQAMSHVLTFLQSAIGDRRVKKIKCGDREIENPSKEDLERFRAEWDRSLEKPEDLGQDTPPGAP
jgi:hypothetical protein